MYSYNNPPYGGFSYPQQSTSGQFMMPQQQAAAPAQNMEGARWVQGEVGARAYQVRPGCTAVLMDAEDSVFYVKSVDTYGMPQPLRKFRFTEEHDEKKNLPQNSGQMDTSNFVTKDDLDQRIKERLEELMK